MAAFMKFLHWLCALWSLWMYSSPDLTIVAVTSGKYQGEKRGDFYAFEGIPYAEAPVKSNRFEPPKPYKETWDELRLVREISAQCLQWDHFSPDRLGGDEDCLYLNIYISEAVKKSTAKVPVVFFIHGGAFMFGGSDANQPLNLMKSGMILVTFNYRLGPLGFMSTQDEVMPGNLGLKDQALALKWVNDNIDNFNGDSKKITVVGFSAGGASTHLFYMSPLTKNLFKNGVSHSGCALNPWVIQENALEKAHKVANHLDCPTNDHKKMLKCLKEQPAGKIVSSVAMFLPFLYNPFSPFGVVVEPPSENAFLLEFPSKLLENGNIYKAPWIASATLDEGLYPAAEFVSNPEYIPEIAKNWNTLAQHILDFNGTFIQQSDKTNIAVAIKKQYFENRPMTPENFHDLSKIISDRLYHYGISKAVQLQSTISPTYFYFFQFKSQFALGEMMSGGRTDLGVAHGEDVFLVFPVAERQKIPFNDEETYMEFKLMEMYNKFANNNEAQFGGLIIAPVQGKIIHHMDILSPTQFGMKTFKENYFGNQIFWDKELNFHLEN